jgi:hypothetical protein
MLIFGEAHLRRILSMYAIYYNGRSGVPHTRNRARTYHCTRMRHCIEQSNGLVPLLLCPSWVDYIIATRGYDFREGQGYRNSGKSTILVLGWALNPSTQAYVELRVREPENKS